MFYLYDQPFWDAVLLVAVVVAFLSGVWKGRWKPVGQMIAGIGCFFLAFWLPRQIGMSLLNVPILIGGIVLGLTLLFSGVVDIFKEEAPQEVVQQQGDAQYQFELGQAYSRGEGVVQDHAKAVEWWTKAAEQGHAFAQHNLGLAYAKAQGMPKDYVKAHLWFNLSADQGFKAAIRARDLILKYMTPAQIAEAQALARNWKRTSRV